MIKFGTLALALGATGVLAETMLLGPEGAQLEVEVGYMPCSDDRTAGKFGKCLVGDSFDLAKCPEGTVCMKKQGGYAGCRPKDRLFEDRPTIKVILCEGDEQSGGSGSPPPPPPPPPRDPTPPPPKTETPPPEDVECPEVPKQPMTKNPRNPNEGNECLASDIFDCATGEQKCECAGNLWRCADSKNPITKACDDGFKCIRKNRFYGICADPNGDRAAQLRADGWEMSEMPCGVPIDKDYPADGP